MSTALKGMVEKLMHDNGATYQNTEYDVLVRVPVQDGTGIKTGASREALEFYLRTKREEMEFYHSWVSKAKVNGDGGFHIFKLHNVTMPGCHDGGRSPTGSG